MATIKSYTELSQSTVLAEILPLESADMKWYFWKSEIDAPKLPTFGYGKDAAETCKSSEAVYLPCWSIAALLAVLPKIGAEEPMIRKLYYANEPKERYICEYGLTNITSEYDNPIDACYEMIIKLHELKML